MRTFVIRLQDDRTASGESSALRGVADEIASGRRTAFASGEELLNLLGATDQHGADREDTSHEQD